MSARFLAPLALALMAAVSVTGCGKRGTLERPPPLFGHHHTDDGDQAGRDSGDQRSGPEKRGPAVTQTPDSRNTTIAADPMDGAPNDPRAGPGQPGNMTPH